MTRTGKAFGASIGALMMLSTLLATGAAADRQARVTTTDERTVGAAEIQAAARARGQGRATDDAIDRHVDEQARAGRMVDAKNVYAAEVGGGVATWERGASIRELRAAAAESTDVRPDAGVATGGIVELAILSEEDADGAAKAPVGMAGAGMLSASYSGGTRLTSTCQTWRYSEQSLTGCYQKFKPTNDGSSTRDYFAYNRWATAVGKDASPDWVPVKIDIRSRPRAGYTSRTKGMTDYFPTSGSQLCNEGSSVTLGVGSLSLTIGLRDCSDKNPIPDATTKTMGVIMDQGSVFDGPRSQGNDFEMEVWTYQGYAVPLLGDYNYAKFCQWTLNNCPAVIGKDGW